MATLFVYGFTPKTKVDSVSSDEESNSSSTDHTEDITEATEPWAKKAKRQFQKKWTEKWPWVKFDESLGIMYCVVCKEVRGWPIAQ